MTATGQTTTRPRQTAPRRSGAALFGAVTAALLLAGCGGEVLRYPVPDAPAPARQSIAYRSVEVREVSLPLYAASEEIAVQGEGGAITTDSDLLWADNPSRAITLELARHLTQISGARVAPEPWPFGGYPQAVLDVRVEELLALSSGALRLKGQYFVAPDASDGGRAGLFDVSAPVPAPGGAAAIAAARAQAVRDLAALIAREGLR